jgi:flagellar basal-body rod modification protein FlgD
MSSVSTLSGLVDSATSAGVNNGTTSATQLNDRFLKLLVAQMNNQDPLNPLDNAQVTSQMAQINTVTGINGLNDTVAKLLDQFTRLESMQAAQLTGRSVLVEGNALTLPANGNAVAGVQLDLPADTVSVDIKDAAGQVVRTLQLGKEDAGITRFEWDGRTSTGDAAAPGNYTFSVTGKTGSTNVTATALAARQVTGVRTTNGTVELVLAGGSAVAYSEIKQIL